MTVISDFSGHNKFLSNFFPCEIITPLPSGEIVRTGSVEHAYQSRKFADESIARMIISAPTPTDAKHIARRFQERVISDWDSIKVSVMDSLLWQKFCNRSGKNSHLTRALISTENSILIEGNTWGDTFWGAVWNKNMAIMGVENPHIPVLGWEGKNVLGTLLTLHRNRLVR